MTLEYNSNLEIEHIKECMEYFSSKSFYLKEEGYSEAEILVAITEFLHISVTSSMVKRHPSLWLSYLNKESIPLLKTAN